MTERSNNEFYARVFRGTYTGSMRGKGQLILALWPLILTEAYPHGIAELHPIHLAGIIGDVEARQVASALEFFCRPDPFSRNSDLDGARLLCLEKYKYRVVSWEHYAQKASAEHRRERAKANSKNYRARKKIETNEDGEIMNTRHQSSLVVIDRQRGISGSSDSKSKNERKSKKDTHFVGGIPKGGSESLRVNYAELTPQSETEKDSAGKGSTRHEVLDPHAFDV